MKSALSVIFGVAAVAFVAAPLTSFAGGTIAGKVTYAGKSEQKEFLFCEVPQPQVLSQEPTQGIDGWGQAVPEDRLKSVRMVV